jgi:hypothetical protein
MPDVFEVLGAAHRDVELMLDRMQDMIGAPAKLRDQGGALADTLITVVSQHEAAEEQYFWPAVRRNAGDGARWQLAASSRRPKGRRCSPSWTGWPLTTRSSSR